VSYDSKSFPDVNFAIYGGTAGNLTSRYGASGTVYLKDKAQANGDLIVDNADNNASSFVTPLRTALTTFRSVKVRHRGRLLVESAYTPIFTVEQPVLLSENGELLLGDGVTLTVTNASGFDFEVASGATLNLASGSTLNADRVKVNGGVLNTSIDLSYATGAEFELSGGGTVNVLNGRTFSIGVFDTSNILAGTFNLPAGSRLNVTSNSMTVGGGVTLIKDGRLGPGPDPSDAIGSLRIESGGVVMHSPRLLTGLVLHVTGELNVQAGGLIDLNAKGLRGGYPGSPFGVAGETYDASDNIVAGAVGGNFQPGASYGGQGADAQGTSNPVYGVLEDARHLGSGGGGGRGGSGGGRLVLTCGSLTVDGTIRANGAPGVGASEGGDGAGSGGGIKIDTGSFGGSGLIQAIGGNGGIGNASNSGSGGGGRIEVSYD
jgi:hypothetical protein